MRRLAIVGVVAASALVAAPAAQAQQVPSHTVAPCATASFLMDKYDIAQDLAGHFPLLEDTARAVCGVTG
jgi:hypothetical protein